MTWRRSWVYENIHGHVGDGECSKRKLQPDERSVWDDYLDMATPPNTPIAGQVCYSRAIGLSVEQLSAVLKTPTDVIERANKKMSDLGMITVGNNGIILINNWKQYQSEYERQKGYRKKLQGEVTPKGYSPKRQIDIDIDKDIDIDIYKSILTYWNNLKIMYHKVEHPHLLEIRRTMKMGWTEEQIKASMRNYNIILRGSEFFFKYKWECREFLRRGIEKFADLQIATTNFIKDEFKRGGEAAEDRGKKERIKKLAEGK